MSKGSIAVPNIIPLMAPGAKATLRNNIFDDTKLEFRSGIPITLPAGKVTVKAIAVSRDGCRQSPAVTRMYNVTSRDPTVSTNKSSMRRSLQNGHRKSSKRDNQPPPDPMLVAALICPLCCAPRPHRSKASFCGECGALYPDLTTQLTHTASSNMGNCPHCDSYISMKSSNCPVCAEHVASAIVPSKAFSLQCASCKYSNPAHASSCSQCEASLLNAKQVPYASHLSPIRPLGSSTKNAKLTKCPQKTCKGLNPTTAIFCIACGIRLQIDDDTNCLKCGYHVPQEGNESSFCANCGSLVLRRERNDEQTAATNIPGQVPQHTNGFSGKPDAARLASFMQDEGSATRKLHSVQVGQELSVLGNTKAGRATRSVGSAHGRVARKHAAVQTINLPTATHSTSTISPGYGFWRKQLEHIVGNLKKYTSEHKQFQQEMSDMRLKEIKGATVDASSSDGIFSLCVDFAIADDSDESDTRGATATSRYKEDTWNRVQRKRRELFENRANADRQSRPVSRSLSSRGKSRSTSTLATPAAKPRSKQATRISDQSQNLIKELQMPEQDIETIENLLEEGADPNVRDANGIPVVAIAIKHGFFEAIPVLIQANADVNVKYGHAGADVSAENGRGETGQAMAIRMGHEQLADLLAAWHSNQLLTNN